RTTASPPTATAPASPTTRAWRHREDRLMLRIRLWFAAAGAVIAVTGLGMITPIHSSADVPSASLATLARPDGFGVQVDMSGLIGPGVADDQRSPAHRGRDRLGPLTDLARRQSHHLQLLSHRGRDGGRHHGGAVRPGPDPARLQPAPARHLLGGPGPEGSRDRG